MALSATMKALLKAAGKTDAEIAAIEAASSAASSSSTKSTKVPVTKTFYPQVFSATQAKSFINKQFQDLFNRDATSAELSKYTKLLNNAQKDAKNAAVQTYKATGSTAESASVTGLDETQWFKDTALADPALNAEYSKIKTQAPSVTNLEESKKLYQDALAKLGPNPDPAAVANLKATTTYGQGLTETENAIKALVRSSDASNTPEEIAKLAEDAYNQGLKVNSNTFSQYVNSNLKFGGTTPQTTVTGPTTPKVFEKTGEVAPTAVTPTTTATGPATPAGGTGGKTLTDLRNIALKNGINLDDPKYADQVNKWVADIKAGADVEKYYSFIRNEAGANKSAWIKKQLAAGSNLSEIYSTAIKQVANAFGLDEASVDLNDPIFSKIFTDKGAVDNNTLATIIHNDSRWTGSPEADKRETAAQLNAQSLENLAKNNNVDLATLFPQGLDAVAKDITDGKTSLEKIANTIRSKAAEGQTKYIQDQLKSGKNLRDIYGTYINAMAKAFNVDASTIELNDALLQQAFTDKGATKLNDFQSLIEKDERYLGTPGALAQTNTKEGALKQLNQVAKANGIDLTSKYGNQVDQWINDVIKGKDINSIAQIIRNDAAAGKSKYVKNQLALGNDLRDIYGVYINQIASAFGVDANTIDLNDPLLANVFTDKGALSTLDFKNLIRKDNRFKNTTGAIGESQTLQSIKDIATQFGSELTDADIASILETAASKGLSANSPEIVNLIRGKIAYKPGASLKGAAGTNLQELKNTAMANGLDLDKMFGSNVQDWLQKIAQGESVDTFKKIIRETAKVGLPDTVKKLIDQGVDLNTIYSPYRNMMANVLEVDPNSIDINDPTLRGAIGPDKEMSLYEWQRALRKDPRWQYTNNAKAEVSNAVQGVLKDFGFVG